MCTRVALLAIAAALILGTARDAAAQLTAAETTDATVLYIDPVQSFVVPHAQRTVENALAFHRALFDYVPRERTTVLLTDFSDAGNASAETVPHNLVTARLAPLSFAYETFTANERMNYLMNHEFVHIVTSDRASARDRMFRRLFGGKVAPNPEHPESLLYYYLTAPRRAAPRWYQEGIAVFLAPDAAVENDNHASIRGAADEPAKALAEAQDGVGIRHVKGIADGYDTER